MFVYTHKKQATTNNQKNKKEYTHERIPICQMQDVRITQKNLTSTQNILQKKNAPEYLCPIPSGQARHHIIPDSILKTFIAKVKENDTPTFLKLITAVKESYMQYHNITQEELANPQLSDFDYIKNLPDTPRNKFLVLITYTKKMILVTIVKAWNMHLYGLREIM